MAQAAGIMILCNASGAEKVLLIRRAPRAGDHPGDWCFPGGWIEEDETAEDAALRETREEIGPRSFDNPVLWTRATTDGLTFTTFIARAKNEFVPKLSHEHTAWMWADVESLLDEGLKAPGEQREMR